MVRRGEPQGRAAGSRRDERAQPTAPGRRLDSSSTRATFRPAEHRLEVVHRTPGRVRVSVTPATAATMDTLVREAGRTRGVTKADPGASGRNLVIRYTSAVITEESLLMRLALALSASQEHVPVKLIRERQDNRLERAALLAGGASGAASLLSGLLPRTALSRLAGWSAALLTLSVIGRSVAADLTRGKPRPEALSLLYLLDSLGSDSRGHGALISWLLYNAKPLADRLAGSRPLGVEVQPLVVKGGVGEDAEGLHLEIVTRPLKERSTREGQLLTPATLVTALAGYLAFYLKQGWLEAPR